MDNHIEVVRFKGDSTTTISRVYLDGKFLCHGLEDAYHPIKDKDKFKGRIRIPQGTYDLGLHESPKFGPPYKRRWSDHKELIHILDVPKFEYILIHTGNTHEHTEGCLLLGTWRNGNFISGSRSAYIRVYRMLYPRVLEGSAYITFKDEDR